jgi:hypothetical protein
MRFISRSAVRTLLVGTLLGLVVLGVGGRLAMAAIQVDAGASPAFSVGGTMTVVFLGAVSGLAGGALALISGAVARRYLSGHQWLRHALFGLLLFLVTMRGLRGSPPAGWWYFYLLVALYGASMALYVRGERRLERGGSSEKDNLP